MKFFKIVLKIIGVIFTLFVIFIVINLSTDRVMPWNKADAIAISLKWGGLAPLPENASEIIVLSKGSMFTRQFVVEFRSDSTSIHSWLMKIKNLANHRFHENSSFKKIDIYPGEDGSMGGFVKVNKPENKVRNCFGF